ncbi:hypothetical protein LZS85_15520 [Aliivibrio fischeri]|uniref:hypothetical protein n=1 Tax=Aliivibrio fischeri TaxID=668 RepID=UPI001F43F574|nr:hypothetical protein [Aliivibrio fischeri]MCE7567532.1 hypothetical protein [Aliivibrio fischeri]
MAVNTLQGGKHKKGKFLAIPKNTPSNATIDAIAENIEQLTGMRGAGGKKAVLWEDLEALDFARMRGGKPTSLLDAAKFNKGTGGGSGGKVVIGGKTVDKPTMPTNVVGHGGFGIATLTWDAAPYNGHAYTEIYQADVDNFSQAAIIAVTPSAIYSTPIRLDGAYYYWIRFVNVTGDVGPLNATAGIYIKSKVNAKFFLDIISKSIKGNPSSNPFAPDIKAVKDMLARDIETKEQLDKLLAEGVMENSVTTDVQTSERRTENLTLKATIETNYYTIADANKAIATAITTLKSSVEDEDGSSVMAMVKQRFATKATLTKSMTQVRNDLRSGLGNLSSELHTNYRTIAQSNSAMSNLEQKLSASVDNVESSIQQVSRVVSDNQDNFEALWGVKANVGDLNASVGLIAKKKGATDMADAFFTIRNADFRVLFDDGTGEESRAVFSTIINPDWTAWDNTKKNPPADPKFVLGKEPVKKILAIDTTTIKVADIRKLVAGNIVADEVVAQSVIKAPRLITPSINDANSNFFLGADGYLSAKHANIEGRIVATSGEFPASLITGKLTASQVLADDFVLKGQTLTAVKTAEVTRAIRARNGQRMIGPLVLNGVVKASNFTTTLVVTYTAVVGKGVVGHSPAIQGQLTTGYLRLRHNGKVVRTFTVPIIQGRFVRSQWVGGGDSGHRVRIYEHYHRDGVVYLQAVLQGSQFGANNTVDVYAYGHGMNVSNQVLTIDLGRA